MTACLHAFLKMSILLQNLVQLERVRICDFAHEEDTFGVRVCDEDQERPVYFYCFYCFW